MMAEEHGAQQLWRSTLFNYLEFITLFLEITQGSRKGITQFFDGLERIVEGDDGTVTGIEHHIAQHVEGIEQVGIVTRDEIPHDNLVFASEHIVCSYPHPAVRRTEEVGMYQLVRLLHIIIIGNDVMPERPHVVIRVVAHLMSFVNYALIEFRMSLYILTHHEESGFGSILLEGVEDERRGFRYRTVIEGEIYRMLLWIYSPECLGVYPPKPF